MRKSRFSILQIETILKEAASGIRIAELCLKHGISVPTFYVWKARSQKQQDQLDAAVESLPSTGQIPPETVKDLADMRQNITNLENENELLRKLFVELSLDQDSARLQEETGSRRPLPDTREAHAHHLDAQKNDSRKARSSHMLINTSIYKKSQSS